MTCLLSAISKHLQHIFLVLLILSSSTAYASILVHTGNQLGDGKALSIHCVRLHYKVDLGEHQVPSGQSYTWVFELNNFHTTQLSCQVKLDGSPDLQFDAYVQRRDSCTRDCDWVFTKHGVFNLRDRVWTFRYAWPDG